MIQKASEPIGYQEAVRIYERLRFHGFDREEALSIVTQYTGLSVNPSLDEIANNFAKVFGGIVVNLDELDSIRSCYR